jgi:hypothetical protein
MIRIAELRLPLSAADAPETPLRALAAQKLGLAPSAIASLTVFKRSFDARKAELLAVYIVDVALTAPSAEPAAAPASESATTPPTEAEAALLTRFAADPHVNATPDMAWRPPITPAEARALTAPAAQPRPVVIGFGPCGMFAALVLAQMGLKPIVLERGTSVRQRTQDTWGLWRKRTLHSESNVQFGEGGAGTFSDGKLYSQIRDPRHLGRKVMQEFVQAGAPEEILFVAHPHIGTFKLVKVVENIREHIKQLGGEVRFEQRVTDIHTENGPHGAQLRGLQVQNLATGESHTLRCDHAVFALGHSARDTFAMLYERGVDMHAKPFSIGFRVEHPQGMIDRARWGKHAGNPLLGAADYKLVHHAQNGRAVYSFCMCPGGTVVAATSEPGRVVTNGMSQYSRNERNANAGIVVGITPQDYPRSPLEFEAELGHTHGAEALAADAHHPLAGIVLQRQLEARAFELGGRNYSAPGQLVGDFVAGKPSTELGDVLPSYKPGVALGDLHPALPPYAIAAMRESFAAFGKKIKGFDRPDAVLTGVETRTSSPVQFERDAAFQSPSVRGLFPAGEGAGYAGGILSAGVDGIKVGEAVALAMQAAR